MKSNTYSRPVEVGICDDAALDSAARIGNLLSYFQAILGTSHQEGASLVIEIK